MANTTPTTPTSTTAQQPANSSVKPAAAPAALAQVAPTAESKKPAAKKAVTKKKTAKKVTAKKPAAKKTATLKKVAAKKATRKTTTRKAAPKTASMKKSASSQNIFATLEGSKDYLKNPTQTMEKMMNNSKVQIDKIAQEATDLGRENMEACMKSGSIFMKGCEDIMKAYMSFAQNAAEKQSKFMKEALSTKTLNDFTTIQSQIAQSQFDDFMAGATQISELSVRVLSDAAEPINAQMTKAVNKVNKTMAA